ncbi:MAG: hypothetical protein LN416_08465 [Candidatus Thermoplasmatota archaeon]|nr:hypothetical protein [Candidatus Thermoplasmatota archaeon]
MVMKRKVDGRHVLYHYLQKELQSDDVWLFQMLASRLVASLGVWFRPSLYKRMPILVPYAVRDPTCRPRKPHEKEEWGSPDPRGYFRDDNTLIKRIPASLRIRSPLVEIYNGRSLGSGFVARMCGD